MTVTTTPKSRHQMRRWAYTPVIAALAVGAVASGTGIGTADPTTEASTEVGAESGQYAWRVHNFTDQTLTAGDFHRDRGADVGSALAFGGDTPWPALKPGEKTADAFQPIGYSPAHTWGRVCYRSQIWNMPRVPTPVNMKSPKLAWNDMYVFALGDGAGGKKLMITRQGGGKDYDVDMNAYGETC